MKEVNKRAWMCPAIQRTCAGEAEIAPDPTDVDGQFTVS
jgi:hypothetical protein